MRNRFDLQLKQLNDDIIEMGNMIERAIEMGVYALIGHDTDKAKQTINYDMDIDHMERDIEALCMKLLLQQQLQLLLPPSFFAFPLSSYACAPLHHHSRISFPLLHQMKNPDSSFQLSSQNSKNLRQISISL